MATPEELINAAMLIKNHCLKTPLCDSRCPLFDENYGDCAMNYVNDCPPKIWTVHPPRQFTDAEIQLAKGYKMLGYEYIVHSGYDGKYYARKSGMKNDGNYPTPPEITFDVFTSIKKGREVKIDDIIAEEDY